MLSQITTPRGGREATLPSTPDCDALWHGRLRDRIFFPAPSLLTALIGFFFLTFELSAQTPQINPEGIINGASFSRASEPLAPGSIAAIFGSNLSDGTPCIPENCGPSFDASGKVIPTLAGAQVTFNGIPAPILSTPGPSQLNVQVPAELAGLAAATVVVTVNGQSSDPATVLLAPATPGLIAANASGTGQGAILNDRDANLGIRSLVAPVGTAPNSHPAAPGDVIEIYLTGVGPLTPSVPTGMRPQGLPRTVATPTLTIGGVPATVLFSGLANCCVGLYQVNAVVPQSLQYGGNLPVFVQIGDVTSQPGLMIMVAGPAAPPTVTTTFTPNAVTIPTSEGAPYGDCDFWVAGTSPCRNQTNLGYGPTKVVRLYICLSGEIPLASCSQNPPVTAPLSTAMLSDINANIAAYAGTGIRLLIRFTYNFGPIGPGAMDAPIDLISAHIDQLAPILLRNKDLIFALEAGFIGAWGEWHDSTNGNDTADAQKVVLDKELSYFNGVFPILVRYPADLMQYTGTTTPPSAFGLHDDYYASDSVDGGNWSSCAVTNGWCNPNYTPDLLMSYAQAVSANTMFVGEFVKSYPTLQTCDALNAYSYMLHAQAISLYPYPPELGTQFQNCPQPFYNQVGARIVLQRAAITGTPIPGAQVSLALTLMNAGYGRVIRQRPVTLVFIQNGQVVAQIPIPLQSLDLRTLASFTTETFNFGFALPATLHSGPLSLALLIPDPAPSLSSSPAYALPLNSLNQNGSPIFDAQTGYNFIVGDSPSVGPAFQIDVAGSLTSSPDEVLDGSYSIKGFYTGTATFTPYLQTVPSVLPLTAGHSYQVTFRYKILATPPTPTEGFQVLFYSPAAGASGNFLPAFTIHGQVGDTGTATLTNTLGAYNDYQARWNVTAAGAISIDDIQITDTTSGTVIATTNAETIVPSPLVVP